jgi:transmembrane protein
MSNAITALLARPWMSLLCRILITFPFWLSGLMKLLNFGQAMGEMQHFGLEPAASFAVLTIIVQIGGSLLIILRCMAWLGAGALIGFTLLTIPIAHAFWRLTGEQAFIEGMFVIEHVSVVGGLLLAAVVCAKPAAR